MERMGEVTFDPSLLDVLGIQPSLGRFFHSTDEHGANSAPYAVLTYAYWHSHFQNDRGIVGRTVEVNSGTQINVEGRQGSLADLQEGTKIRASYETREGKDIATRIEVVPVR